MELLYTPKSPYVRMVMVVLHETGQLGDVTLTDSTTSPLDPPAALTAFNPLSKVPVLVRSDGPALYDSRVICAFLDARADAGLYGEGPARWDIVTLEATAQGMLDAALQITYEGRFRAAEHQLPEMVDAQWGKIMRACDALEARWMSQLARPLHIGHIATACALGYLDFRHDARGWRQGHGVLAEWYATFAERPSMQATEPPRD